MDLNQLAKVGDVIEATIKHPTPGTIRIILDTAEACAEANCLLLNKIGEWKLVSTAIEN